MARITLTQTSTSNSFDIDSSQVLFVTALSSGSLISFLGAENNKFQQEIVDETASAIGGGYIIQITLSDGSTPYINKERVGLISEHGTGSVVSYKTSDDTVVNLISTQTVAQIKALL